MCCEKEKNVKIATEVSRLLFGYKPDDIYRKHNSYNFIMTQISIIFFEKQDNTYLVLSKN